MTRGISVSADRLASDAGTSILAAGGNAVDAAIATNAVMAVVAPHLCGVGGDLFALVHDASGDEVTCLVAAGRAGAGANAQTLREEGRRMMPLFGDVRSVTVPGCVDGWVALHERYGTLPLRALLAPAVRLAQEGFPASPLLVRACAALDAPGRAQLAELADQASEAGSPVRRPGLARTLVAIGEHGRDAFYRGEFGQGLLALGSGWYAESDLAAPGHEWVTPLRVPAFGVELWAAPPVSQGYLWLAAAAIADRLDLPSPHDPLWAHLLVESAVAAGRDRQDVLHDGADGQALLEVAASRDHEVDPARAGTHTSIAGSGDTTYLATVDEHGFGVSLIQSNASGFGSRLVEPSTRINLHNRGLGFSLVPGHPAELKPGVRPPHTLVPGLATDSRGLRAVLGTMGGDAQPQVLLQLAARLFRSGQPVREAVDAGRWALQSTSGFDTWASSRARLAIEGNAPGAWLTGLLALGHDVVETPAYDSSFGHAHAIVRTDEGWEAAADPRTVVGGTSTV